MKNKETLEEVAENYAKESIFSIEEKRAFIDGAEWQQEPEQFFNDDRVKTLEKGIEYLLKRQERMYSEGDLDAFRKFMIQEQNFSKSCLDVFIEQLKNK